MVNYQTFEPIITWITAAIAVYIAYQQHRTARYQLKHDLYNKRYRVYSITTRFLDHMIISKELDKNLFREFIDAENESMFLFEQDLYDRLELYYKLALHFESYRSFKVAEIEEPIPDWMINALNGHGPDHINKFSDLQAKVTLYFKDEFFRQKGYFKKYLDFKKMK